ncbi:MAG: hypothetical protein K2L00_07725 [Muribaculaceae bacterium]|nr:hypothetical protein [Muribaculaceae bacterium]
MSETDVKRRVGLAFNGRRVEHSHIVHVAYVAASHRFEMLGLYLEVDYLDVLLRNTFAQPYDSYLAARSDE